VRLRGRDDPPFTGQGGIGRLDGATRCAKLCGEAANRRQAFARPHVAGGDGYAGPVVNLAKQRDELFRSTLNMVDGPGIFMAYSIDISWLWCLGHCSHRFKQHTNL